MVSKAVSYLYLMSVYTGKISIELDKQKNLRNTDVQAPGKQNGPEGVTNRSLHDSQHAKASSINGSNGISPHALAAAARSAIEWLLQIRQAQRRGGSDHAIADLWVFQKKGEVVNDDIIVSHCCFLPVSNGSPIPAFAVIKSRRPYSRLLRILQKRYPRFLENK